MASAVNGLEGLKALAEKRFDFVFVDLNMPVMNGLEMMQRLNELDKKEWMEHTVFILCTAQSQESGTNYLSLGLKYYCKRYILLPLSGQTSSILESRNYIKIM